MLQLRKEDLIIRYNVQKINLNILKILRLLKYPIIISAANPTILSGIKKKTNSGNKMCVISFSVVFSLSPGKCHSELEHYQILRHSVQSIIH
jgi:hypothetical protein